MLALLQKAMFSYKTSKIFFIYHCVHSRFSRVLFCVILWTVARQAPLSMGFSRQEYQSGLPCPSLEQARCYQCCKLSRHARESGSIGYFQMRLDLETRLCPSRVVLEGNHFRRQVKE